MLGYLGDDIAQSDVPALAVKFVRGCVVAAETLIAPFGGQRLVHQVCRELLQRVADSGAAPKRAE